MIDYLQKSKGSEGFHQIINFLNASHIQYALTENPTIYVSFIKQFWSTATARTSATREVELTATINGQEKTIIEASLRRHLKLEDNGSRTVATFPIFIVNKFMSLGSDEGSLTLNELTVLCTTLSKKVEDLKNDLNLTKLTYGAAYTKLILRVKKLEHKVKASKSKRRARVIISDNEKDLEDSYKQGDNCISTASAITEVSTAIPKRQVYIKRSAEKRKDKGKEEIDIARQEQEKYDLAQALELQKELDKRKEGVAKTTQAQDSEIEKEVMKRYGFDFQKPPAKRQKVGEVSGSIEEQYAGKEKDVKYPIIDWEVFTKESRSYWRIKRVGNHTEVYQVFEEMLKRFDRDDLDISWDLVNKKFSSTEPTIDKEEHEKKLILLKNLKDCMKIKDRVNGYAWICSKSGGLQMRANATNTLSMCEEGPFIPYAFTEGAWAFYGPGLASHGL
ncbi:hypothetical protein Tco_0851528 [Tanacetum coccineum]